jgi:hypothetical protein
LVAQIERHQPSLLDVGAPVVAPTVEIEAVTRFSRFRLRNLRRLRRAA